MGVENQLTDLAEQMVKYAREHSFKGDQQEVDLLGFCELNKRYSRLQRELPPLYDAVAEKYSRARNRIVTYITQKVNDYPAKEAILVEVLSLISDSKPADKNRLKKAL